MFIDNQGLYRYSSKFQKIKIHPQDTFTNNYITSGTFLDGKFLFITSKNKLYEFEQDLKISEKIKNLVLEKHSSPILTFNHSNNLVVYSLNGGVHFYDTLLNLNNELLSKSTNCHMWDKKR